MCYNTGDIDSPGESNSILDLEDAKKYLQGKHRAYPLPLDVALPVFPGHWYTGMKNSGK